MSRVLVVANNGTAPGSITTSYLSVVFSNTVTDSLGTIYKTASSWIFSCPVAGTYSIAAVVGVYKSGPGLINVTLQLQKNGQALITSATPFSNPTAAGNICEYGITYDGSLAQDDVISCMIQAASTGLAIGGYSEIIIAQTNGSSGGSAPGSKALRRGR